MRYTSTLITAVMLTGILAATSPVKAQEMDDPADPCVGAAALVCAALAIPLAIAVIDEAIDAACPGAFPPGEWPEDAQAAFPQYPEQWYRDCGDA